MNLKQLVLVLIALALMGLAVRYVLNSYKEADLVHMRFRSIDGRLSPEFKLEVARNASARAKGLMYRKALPELGGMFFAFTREEQHSFWMKNTYVSLDLVFLDSALKVVGVLSEVPVLSDEARKINAPSLYVVELPAGSAKRFGIAPGSLAEVKGQVPRGA